MFAFLYPLTICISNPYFLLGIRANYTRNLFKNIRNTKGTLHTKNIIKDRNNIDPTDTDDIKKRWQEYTEELYKKILMTRITTMV